MKSAEWPPESGKRVIIKDLRGRALWFRLLYGRHVLRREWKVLRALSDVKGVPHVVAKPHADVLVMEQVSGTSVAKMGAVQLDAKIIERLENLMARLHARGVTHGDLHSDNILVDENGNVHLIDWATAHLGGHQNRWLFQEWRALDLRAIAKVKLIYAKEQISDADLDMLENRTRAYRAVKGVRHKLDKLRGKQRSDEIDKTAAKVRRKRARQTATGAFSKNKPKASTREETS